MSEFEYLKDIKNVQNQLVSLSHTNHLEYLKAPIPQAYKIIIESKTIDIKFQLNQKNNNK